jgi:N-acetylglucosaminyldiphosphoundecaprenol N-acetyl-beta-D-mannosaminyltransferase
MTDASAGTLRVDILGCAVDRLTMQTALEKLERLIASPGKHQVIVLPVNSVMTARRDAGFRKICNASPLVLPDGVPVLWASRLLGRPIPGRVAGSDLFWELSRLASRRGWSCYLLGSRAEVLEALEARLRERFPGLIVAGRHAPPLRHEFPAAVTDDIIARINAAHPDILWVGIGAPKQERWIHANLEKVNAKLAIGVGAAFDLCSGSMKRAPRWMQRCGLEWLYRFIKEPRRLFRRYFIEAMPFLPLVLARRLNDLFTGHGV